MHPMVLANQEATMHARRHHHFELRPEHSDALTGFAIWAVAGTALWVVAVSLMLLVV